MKSKNALPNWALITVTISLIGIVIMLGIGLAAIITDDNSAQTEANPQHDDARTPAQPGITIEAMARLTPTNTSLPSATVAFTPSPIATAIRPSPTPANTIVVDPVTASTSIALEVPSAAATNSCTAPAGWEGYRVQQGDTLFAFQLGANRAGTPATVDEIMAANCLDSRFLTIDQFLYLPPGAADNAPPSEPVVEAPPAGVPRTANCPCTITVQAGWRIEQIADAINSRPVSFSGADFLAVAGSGAAVPAREFLAGVPPGNSLEGFMLPGSYTVQNDTTAIGFRDMMLDAFASSAAGIMNNASAQGITPYQALGLASIIQKESGNPEDQRLVASVFYNRMRSGRALGATVTIQYALGAPGNWWPRLRSGQTSIDSPYNTYRFTGIPPSPISNPSLSALQAAASPAQTNYLYFTGNCRGPGNAYAVTYDEHLANVNCQ